MQHIVLFSYMFAIFFCIGGFTMALLSDRRARTSLTKAAMLFALWSIITCCYDMLIYYSDYIIGGMESLSSIRIGNCIIAILFYFWLMLIRSLTEERKFDFYYRMTRNYVLVYAVGWAVLTCVVRGDVVYALKWILLASDMVLMLMVLIGSIIYAICTVWNSWPRGMLYYIIVVTAMIMWNYVSYFWSETSVYWGNSEFIRTPMDLTIIFWFVVNIATLVMIYRRIFSHTYAKQNVEKVDIQSRLNELAIRFDLTGREKDIVRLIYGGKSNGEISGELFISESTVKTHIYNIFRKLGVKNRMSVMKMLRDEDDSE